MTETTPPAEEHEAKREATQDVVNRVTSWQHGATEETIREELDKGFEQAEVEVPEESVESVAEEMHHTRDNPDVEEHLE